MARQDLYTDLYDDTKGTLYEVKASEGRESVRMALGQILDYSRLLPEEAKRVVLLPAVPADDLVALLRSHRVACVVSESQGFRQVKPRGASSPR